MPRLHLVGFTTDLKNLIFATRRGAKSGGYMVELDDRLRRTLIEIERREDEARREAAKAAFPQKPEVPLVSKLSPKEIQGLLREGKTVSQVAQLAETDVEWIGRFLGPILTERAVVVSAVQASTMSKPRLGPSGASIADAVRANLVAKKVDLEPEDFDDAWDAHRRANRWIVTFTFRHRGAKKVARFSYSVDTREVTPSNSVASEMGWLSATKPSRRSKTSATSVKRKSTPGKKRTAAKSRPASKKAKSKRPVSAAARNTARKKVSARKRSKARR